MKVGDLIIHANTPHIVISIEQSIPVARKGVEIAVLKNTKTLETRRVPMKWLRG